MLNHIQLMNGCGIEADTPAEGLALGGGRSSIRIRRTGLQLRYVPQMKKTKNTDKMYLSNKNYCTN